MIPVELNLGLRIGMPANLKSLLPDDGQRVLETVLCEIRVAHYTPDGPHHRGFQRRDQFVVDRPVVGHQDLPPVFESLFTLRHFLLRGVADSIVPSIPLPIKQMVLFTCFL